MSRLARAAAGGWRRPAWLLAAVLVVSCASSDSARIAPEEPAEVATTVPGAVVADPAAATAAWAELTSTIGPDGVVGLDTARRAFAATIAPLPGVEAGVEPVDGNAPGSAAEWIQSYLDELTPEQRLAVDAAVSVDEAAPVGPSSGPGRSVRRPRVEPWANELGMIAWDAVGFVRARLELDSGTAWQIAVVNSAAPVPFPAPVWVAGGVSGKPCTVYVRRELGSWDPARQRRALLDNLPSVVWCELQSAFLARVPPAPLPWVSSGLSSWVACEFARAAYPELDGSCRALWGWYMSSPGLPLFERTGDALGFVQQLHVTLGGMGAWAVIGDGVQAMPEGSVAAYDALTAKALPGFAQRWGPQHAMRSDLGPDWSVPDPRASGHGDYSLSAVVSNGPAASWSAPPYTVLVVHLSGGPGVDVLALDTSGFVRVAAEGSDGSVRDQTFGTAEEGRFVVCTRPGGCACPDTGESPVPAGDAGITVGLTGHRDGASVSVTTQSLDDLCLDQERTVELGSGGSCELFPTAAVERAAGVSLGSPMVPPGFDPNPLGGQIGCVWPDVPGWSVQITANAAPTRIPTLEDAALLCRVWAAKAVVGLSRTWYACVGTAEGGLGFLHVTTPHASYLVTTPPYDLDTLKRIGRAIGEGR